MFKKILVPTDGSELSEQAASAAVDFARGVGAEIVALSVAQPFPLVPSAEAAMVTDPGIDTQLLLEHAAQNAGKVAERAKAAGVPCATRTALNMSPYQEIIRTAEKEGCDVIFMASHGRRGLSKLLAGSETQNVLAYSTIPVMVLRAPAHRPGS